MKRVVLMVSLSLFPRLLVAQELDVASLAGDNWYGAYLNGQKVGYALSSLTIGSDGAVSLIEDARFRMTMSGVDQEMNVYVKRTYAKSGNLLRIEQKVDDAGGEKTFNATVLDDKMEVVTKIGDTPNTRTFPKPKESLKDALKQADLIKDGAKIGDELTFSIFEPMYERETAGLSRIEGIEEQILDGVPTKVFKVRSTIEDLGLDSVAYVTQDGKTLQDQIGGIITMRLEPKEMAQDITYRNDVIVSNAASVDQSISDPRTRSSLHLRVYGPLAADKLFNDERQKMTQKEGYIDFVGTLYDLKGFQAAKLPVTEPSVQEWLKATTFVQSNDPRLAAKAKEIVGDEKDSFAASAKLCEWVYANVRTTYSARLSNALEVLDHPEGDCTEHSILFVGLARAAGLPAREVAGLIYVSDSKPAFYFHQWAKVWIGKWVDVDPTFNQPLADATHIKLAEGDLFEQARIIPTIGQIRVEVAEGAEGETK
ncbi:MAG: transglutaminase-like domain-containing protein [Armatimonadetes bacterium]|nr:transglutaminase-like domain-containing protein [Armatimonadota bacterium]